MPFTTTNKHNVQGESYYNRYLQECFTPDCCLNCKHLESEYTSDGLHFDYSYCGINIKMPIKKGMCKRQKSINTKEK